MEFESSFLFYRANDIKEYPASVPNSYFLLHNPRLLIFLKNSSGIIPTRFQCLDLINVIKFLIKVLKNFWCNSVTGDDISGRNVEDFLFRLKEFLI
jgi:hypothetical protein